MQVTGVCLVDADKDQEPRSFRLLLSSPSGVRVLAQPTWWNLGHTLATLGLMLLLVIAALAWVASLRYRVREQTEIIRRRLEHQTVLEERFKDLVEHAVEGIFRIAPDGRYAAVNKALARMLGYAGEMEDVTVESLVPERLRGVTPAEFLTMLPECDAEWARRVSNAKEKGEVLRYRARATRGGVRVGLVSVPLGSPLASLDGTDNLFVFSTARYRDRPLVVSGPGAGAEVTAAGVLGDVLRIIAA